MSPDAPDRPSPRFFSYEEANRTLPLVRGIVADIRVAHARLEPLIARYNALPIAERQGRPGTELQRKVTEAADELEALVAELHELGCQFKGFDEGLVDWYSYYAGRPVLLCWKAGEPAIEWWHQLDAGFAGRQPILPSQREAFTSTPDGLMG